MQTIGEGEARPFVPIASALSLLFALELTRIMSSSCIPFSAYRHSLPFPYLIRLHASLISLFLLPPLYWGPGK